MADTVCHSCVTITMIQLVTADSFLASTRGILQINATITMEHECCPSNQSIVIDRHFFISTAAVARDAN